MDYMKQYIEISKEFRSQKDKNINPLFDLLYELQAIDEPTKEEYLVLSNLYTLLEFHQSAYDTFSIIADPENRKDSSKLFVLKEKAQGHLNKFALKDIRKQRKKLKQVSLQVSDLRGLEEDETHYTVIDNEVIIFNKKINDNNITICFPDKQLEKHLPAVNEYLYWLSDCMKDLINYYNTQNPVQDANPDWYHTLEIFRVEVNLENTNNLFATVVAGDSYLRDHLLDIELENREIISMNYDG